MKGLFFNEIIVARVTKARRNLVCLGPGDFDSVAQGSENEVIGEENVFNYYTFCFSCLSGKQRHNLAGM